MVYDLPFDKELNVVLRYIADRHMAEPIVAGEKPPVVSPVPRKAAGFDFIKTFLFRQPFASDNGDGLF